MTTDGPGSLPPPPPGAWKWGQAMLGLLVTTVVALAPLLGKVDVPLFDALLTFYPVSLHSYMFPLAAMLMGVVATVVQYFAGPVERRKRQRIAFTIAGAVVVLLLMVVGVYASAVTRTEVDGGDKTYSYVTGFGERPTTCDDRCQRQLSNAECINRRLTHQADIIQSCFTDSRVQLASGVLVITYLLLMLGIASLVGLGVSTTPKS